MNRYHHRKCDKERIHLAVINDIGTIDVGIWIAGQWVETKEKIAVRNKFNGETLGFVGKADKEQTEWAVTNAKETFEKVKLSPYERSVILNKMAQKLKENKE